MGDVWPFGPPAYTTYDDVVSELESLGMGSTDANIGAAVCTAESSLDLTVVNDTPSTGDYSVGMAQINYYNGLYDGRVKAFGTPRHLALSGVRGQASAMYTVWLDAGGFTPWSTFNHGTYKQYLHGKGGPAVPPAGLNEPAAPSKPGKDTWSKQIGIASNRFDLITSNLSGYADTIKDLR